MSETAVIILVLGFVFLQLFTHWLHAKGLDKQEQLFQARWRRMVSALSGQQDHVELRGLDPTAKDLVEQVQEEGLLDG